MEFKVNKYENFLFALKVFFTLIVLLFIVSMLLILFNDIKSTTSMIYFIIFYAGFIILYVFIHKVFLIAYMKGNGICVSENQFPEVYREYRLMAERLNMKKLPKLFIIQQGGMLNAFAIRFSGKNYIAIYSDIFSILHSDMDTLKFVIGHELAHVKRKHMSKIFWTLPSIFVPFLESAYSRACEYTCDNFGASLVNKEFIDGLVLLAAGKDLYKNINIKNYLEEYKVNNTFAVKFAGLFISHPYLPKRIKNINPFL